MVRLTTLGAVQLRSDVGEVRSVLTQPKRLALLVYLAVNSANGFLSRERVTALFWPESNDEKARNALRQALHYLRRALGEDVFATRGEHELALNTERAQIDTLAFSDALAVGRASDALELYKGEFLSGLHVADAPEVERWITDQRSHYRHEALRAADEAARIEEQRGDLRASVLFRRRALVIDPHDEPSLQKLLEVLGRLGQRATALETYADFARRFEAELGLTPSAATQAALERVRHGGEPAGSGHSVTTAQETQSRVRVDGTQTDRQHKRRVRPLGALLVVAAALVVIALLPLRRRGGTPNANTQTAAIAVLPFSNLSGDPSHEYFSDGMSEELMSALARVPGLHVVARTSAFAFKGQPVAVDSIARALRVQHLLEGSVRIAGDRLRVTAKLVNASTGFQAWSDTYEARLSDVFSVQDSIAQSIVAALETNLARGAESPVAETSDPEAYRSLLHGLQVQRQETMAAYSRADSLFQSALARDSGYARAWAALAHVRLLNAYRRLEEPAGGYQEAAALAERALTIDRRLAAAHVVLGRVAEDFEWDFAAAERHYRQALAVAPADEIATRQLSRLCAHLGRAEEATLLSQRLVARDPLAAIAHRWHGSVLTLTGQHDRALNALRKAVALQPENAVAYSVMTFPLVELGQFEEATASGERALVLAPQEQQFIANAAWAYARAGLVDQARGLLNRLEAMPLAAYYYRAMVQAGLGNADDTFALLDQAIDKRESFMPQLASLPAFRSLHRDPRFDAALRRVGLTTASR